MKDLTNIRFGRLVATKPVGKTKDGNVRWLCKCDCGSETVVTGGHLIQRHTLSCGCLRNDSRTFSLYKHGFTMGGKPRTFVIWCGMKARCYTKSNISYKSYGAKGVSICNEWLGEHGFENFHKWAVSNGYKDGLEIDRINTHGNYEPSNCQWVTKAENQRKQRNTRFFEVNGINKNINEWCKFLRISKATAYKKLKESEKAFVDYLFMKMKDEVTE